MEIAELINSIASKQGCEVMKREQPIDLSEYSLPADLNYYLSNYNGIKLFTDNPFGITIVGFDDFKVTNKILYPEGDVIWEELEGDISENWYLIAKAEELEQYISIDLGEERKGYCYDSFLETHANPGLSLIIAKSFTELLFLLLKAGGEHWYWTEEDFEGYGDAYDD